MQIPVVYSSFKQGKTAGTTHLVIGLDFSSSKPVSNKASMKSLYDEIAVSLKFM